MRRSLSTVDLRTEKSPNKVVCSGREFHSETADRRQSQKTNAVSTPLTKVILPELDDTITSDSSEVLSNSQEDPQQEISSLQTCSEYYEKDPFSQQPEESPAKTDDRNAQNQPPDTEAESHVEPEFILDVPPCPIPLQPAEKSRAEEESDAIALAAENSTDLIEGKAKFRKSKSVEHNILGAQPPEVLKVDLTRVGKSARPMEKRALARPISRHRVVEDI